MDTYERVSPAALKQASVVVAAVLYDAAMRDAKIPRMPLKDVPANFPIKEE
jgi:carboxypeptidase Q